jgi:hypothetical protein
MPNRAAAPQPNADLSGAPPNACYRGSRHKRKRQENQQTQWRHPAKSGKKNHKNLIKFDLCVYYEGSRPITHIQNPAYCLILPLRVSLRKQASREIPSCRSLKRCDKNPATRHRMDSPAVHTK